MGESRLNTGSWRLQRLCKSCCSKNLLQKHQVLAILAGNMARTPLVSLPEARTTSRSQWVLASKLRYQRIPNSRGEKEMTVLINYHLFSRSTIRPKTCY